MQWQQEKKGKGNRKEMKKNYDKIKNGKKFRTWNRMRNGKRKSKWIRNERKMKKIIKWNEIKKEEV